MERKKTRIFKTWKGKKQESLNLDGKKQVSLRPGREKEGIFKTSKGKTRNI
jgi:hypothetical protein